MAKIIIISKEGFKWKKKVSLRGRGGSLSPTLSWVVQWSKRKFEEFGASLTVGVYSPKKKKQPFFRKIGVIFSTITLRQKNDDKNGMAQRLRKETGNGAFFPHQRKGC